MTHLLAAAPSNGRGGPTAPRCGVALPLVPGIYDLAVEYLPAGGGAGAVLRLWLDPRGGAGAPICCLGALATPQAGGV